MDKKPLSFGKTMLASGLGMILAFVVIGILGMLVMVGSIAALSSKSAPSATQNDTFLKLDLTKTLTEQNPGELQNLFSNNDGIGLISVLRALEYAKHDDRVLGVYLYFGTISNLSWGQSEELRMALEDFQTAGKPVVAYADSYSQTGYYVATLADHLLLGTAGQVDLRGIAAQPMFYKDLLDKYDVHMDLIRPRSNAYKSAGETYTMNHISEANKEQIRAYITSIWNHVSEQIAHARHTEQATVNQWADQLYGYLPEKAVESGIVDSLCVEKDARNLQESVYGMKHIQDIEKYAAAIPYTRNSDQIAIIYAEGDVVSGTSKSIQTAVYGDDIAQAFDDAADDRSIKAIVLRVNSPGGAVLASETMTAAVERAKEKKPVIVSMSNLAASAGYEISCNATKIVALPTTLTGSIGVFAAIPEVGTALKKHLGITTDTVLTNRNAAGVNGLRPMTSETREVMQNNIESFYRTFVGRVAKGRNMTFAQVDEIARGRVWTGSDALGLGLVDTLGNFATALSIAAQEAQIENYSIVEFPKEKHVMNQIMDLMGGAKLSQEPDLASLLRQWAGMETYQARIPFILNIE